MPRQPKLPIRSAGIRNSTSKRIWWEPDQDADEVFSIAFEDFKKLAQDDVRQAAYREYGSLYANRALPANSSILAPYRSLFQVDKNRYSRTPYNLISFCVDQAQARLVKSTPMPEIQANDANFDLGFRAGNMQKWLDFVLYKEFYGDVFRQVVRDGLVYGLGILKTFTDKNTNDVCMERVFPGNIFVDPVETIYGAPKRMFHRELCSRYAIAQEWPEHEEYIMQCQYISDILPDTWGFSETEDQIEVVEGWHLPSSDGAGDGRHVIFVGTRLLLNEPWKRTDFPVSTYTWKPDILNRFYGQGITDIVVGLHADVNHTIRQIERAIELIPKPIVLAERGSKITPSKMTNLPGTILYYTGKEPKIQLLQSVALDLLQYKDDQIQRALQLVGLGTAATEGLPAGLETGAAVRAHFDTQSVPFADQLKRAGEFCVDVANKAMSSGKQLYDSNPEYTVVGRNDKYSISEVKWADCSLNPREDSYVLSVAPVSALSQHPASRRAEVMELYTGQLIDRDTALRLLDMPDLQKLANADRAKFDNGMRLIDLILTKGEYYPPEPFMDMPLLLQEANKAYNRAELQEVPEPRLAMLRMLMREINNTIAQTEQAAMLRQQGMTPAGAAPPGPGLDGSVPTEPNPTLQ